MRREVTHLGFKLTIWEKSFKVDSQPVIYIGADPKEFAQALEKTIRYVVWSYVRRWIKGGPE